MSDPKPWRPGQGQAIEAMYAWVATEPDGGEGICSMTMELMGRPVQMPLVGADVDRMRSLRPQAELIRKASGYPVRLIRFSRRDDLEILD